MRPASPLSFDIKNSSFFNVMPSANANRFALFANYTGTMDVEHNGNFDGLLCFPLANILTHNSGDVNGALWGRSGDSRNSGTPNLNTAFADMYASKELTETISRDLRNGDNQNPFRHQSGRLPSLAASPSLRDPKVGAFLKQ